MERNPLDYSKNPPAFRLGDRIVYTNRPLEEWQATQETLFAQVDDDQHPLTRVQAVKQLRKDCLFGTLERRHDDYLVVGDVIQAFTYDRLPHLDHQQVPLEHVIMAVLFRGVD